MSDFVHHDYGAAAPSCAVSPAAWSFRRLIIAGAGCFLMALSGMGLANYLDTSSVTGADATSVDSASLN